MTITMDRPAAPPAERLHGFSTSTPAPDLLASVLGSLPAAEQMQKRAVLDMLNNATAAYWERRAELLEWAMPRPTDYNGLATPEQLAARAERLRSDAEQCRNHARLLRGEPLV